MNFESWPIVRTKPGRKSYGRSISLFFNSAQCYLTTIGLYEDGLVDCCGCVDLAQFRAKLHSGWIVSAPKADQDLSVFGFGFTGVKNGSWVQTSQDIEEEVHSILRSLNPEMRNLVDINDVAPPVYGGGWQHIVVTTDGKPYRKDRTGGDVLGTSVPLLCAVDGGWELTRLTVFADGMCQVGAGGERMPMANLPSLYEHETIANFAPAGSTIRLPGLGQFQTTTDFGGVSIPDRIAEIQDEHNVLNGRPSIVTSCARLFQEYQRRPSPLAKAALRECYEAVPKQLRPYCGDMDSRDYEIRAAIYGDSIEAILGIRLADQERGN